MIEQVKKTIEEHSLLQKGDRVVVGVSGGPDSMALLNILLELRKDFDLQLTVAHQIGYFDPKKKDLDEKYSKVVQDFCKEKSIPFEHHVVDHSTDSNKEEAARRDRYGLFEEVARKLDKQVAGGRWQMATDDAARPQATSHKPQAKIALAHNYDDNVETVLINLFRGAGIRGLSGIPYKRGRIIRPCLDIPKAELEKYCEKNDIPFIKDYANRLAEPLRNKIRHKLIPYIKKEIGIDITKPITGTSKVMKDAEQYLNEELRIKSEELRIDEDVQVATEDAARPQATSHKPQAKYDLKKWEKLPRFIRLEFLRRLALKKNKGKDLGYRHLLEIEDMLLNSENGAQKELVSGLTITKGYGNFKVQVSS